MSYPREGTSHNDSGDDPDDGYPRFSVDFDECLTTIEICAECGGTRETCKHIDRPKENQTCPLITLTNEGV